MWKIVKVSETSVIYIYIYIDEEPSLYYGQAKDTNQFLFVSLREP